MMQRLQRLMMGRYGSDPLNMTLLVVAILLSALASLTPVLTWIGMVFLLVAVFRMFSKNIVRRRRENAVFVKVFVPFKRMYTEFRQRKTYRFYTCPKCKQRVRVPRGRGRISISCPKCHEKFIKTV